MAGSWTPGGGAVVGLMDTLSPADALPVWLRSLGWYEAAALVEAGSVVPGSPAEALLDALRALWQARCQGVDLGTLRVFAQPVWVLCSGEP